MSDLTTGLQRLADRAAESTLASASEIRAAGERRRRRQVGTAVLTTVATIVALLAVTRAFGTEARTDRQEPVKPVEPRSAALTFRSVDIGFPLMELDADDDVTPLLSSDVLDDACSNCLISALSWSPDGSRAAFLPEDFTRDQNGDPVGWNDVWLIEGGRLRKLFACPGEKEPTCDAGSGSRLAWSPDGRLLYFASEGRLYQATVDAATVEPTPLAACPSCTGEHPDPSPDGAWVAFWNSEGLFRIPSSGGQPQLVAALKGVSSAAWSPDGTQMVVDARDGVHLLDLRAAGTPTDTLVFGQAPGEGPGGSSWSPDGQRIAFFNTPRVDDKFEAEVWAANVGTGAPPTRLRRLGCCVSDWRPITWSPDGRRLALQVELKQPTVLILDSQVGTTLLSLPGIGPIAWRNASGPG
jgi:Tol biopolymer transport system component